MLRFILWILFGCWLCGGQIGKTNWVLWVICNFIWVMGADRLRIFFFFFYPIFNIYIYYIFILLFIYFLKLTGARARAHLLIGPSLNTAVPQLYPYLSSTRYGYTAQIAIPCFIGLLLYSRLEYQVLPYCDNKYIIT